MNDFHDVHFLQIELEDDKCSMELLTAQDGESTNLRAVLSHKIAFLLNMKKQFPIIYYSKSGKHNARLAQEISEKLTSCTSENTSIPFWRSNKLLILDRFEDVTTPLRSESTVQSILYGKNVFEDNYPHFYLNSALYQETKYQQVESLFYKLFQPPITQDIRTVEKFISETREDSVKSEKKKKVETIAVATNDMLEFDSDAHSREDFLAVLLLRALSTDGKYRSVETKHKLTDQERQKVVNCFDRVRDYKNTYRHESKIPANNLQPTLGGIIQAILNNRNTELIGFPKMNDFSAVNEESRLTATQEVKAFLYVVILGGVTFSEIKGTVQAQKLRATISCRGLTGAGACKTRKWMSFVFCSGFSICSFYFLEK